MSERAQQNLRKIPVHIARKLMHWIDEVDTKGVIHFVEIVEVNKHEY